MNKLTYILLIGLLFFSDINAIKIKVSKVQNALRKTHNSKQLTAREQKIADCVKDRLVPSASISLGSNIYSDPKKYAKSLEIAAKKAKEDCTEKIDKEEKEIEEQMKKNCNCPCQH